MRNQWISNGTKRTPLHHLELRQASDTPTELPNGTPMELIKNSIKIPFENPTKTPPTNQNPRQWNTTPFTPPKLHQLPTISTHSGAPHPSVDCRYYNTRVNLYRVYEQIVCWQGLEWCNIFYLPSYRYNYNDKSATYVPIFKASLTCPANN